MPPVLTCSGLTGAGVPEVWERVLAHRDHLGADGLAAKRAEQQLDFTWTLVRDELAQRLRRSPGVRAVRDEVRAAVLAGDLPASVAADRLLAAYDAARASPGRAAELTSCRCPFRPSPIPRPTPPAWSRPSSTSTPTT